jgi:hypothetical protein
MYTVVAAAAVVTGVGTAGAVVGPAPTAQTAAQLATIAYTGAGSPFGPAEASMFQTALGPSSTRHDSAPAASGGSAPAASAGQCAPASSTGQGSAPVSSTEHDSAHASTSGPAVGQNHDQAGQERAGSGQEQASSGQSASQSAPIQPYLLYDSVSPFAIPHGQRIATYIDGPFAISPSAVADRPSVLWIDTSGRAPETASALDVEPGDATPAGAARWVQEKLSASPNSTAVVYTTRSEWSQVRSDISLLPFQVQSHVRYWIADPTGVPHTVPGASATQWYWGSRYDISTVTGF